MVMRLKIGSVPKPRSPAEPKEQPPDPENELKQSPESIRGFSVWWRAVAMFPLFIAVNNDKFRLVPRSMSDYFLITPSDSLLHSQTKDNSSAHSNGGPLAIEREVIRQAFIFSRSFRFHSARFTRISVAAGVGAFYVSIPKLSSTDLSRGMEEIRTTTTSV
jgi:hypothetical protein